MFYTNVQPHGNFIALRGVDDNGEHFQRKVRYEPTLYVPTQKESEWKTLEGKRVAPVKWGSMKESREAMRDYGANVYGPEQFQYPFISDTYQGDINYDISKVRIAYIDIECGSEHGFPNIRLANEEVLAVSIKIDDNFKTYACGDYTPPSHVEYIRCSNEAELLTSFVNDWMADYPDIVTGWNTRFFDIPYLVNRICNVLGSKMADKLSPWGWLRENEINLMGGRKQQVYELVGISSIDYMDCYTKFTYRNHESFALNHIAYVELGEKKLDYSEVSTLHELYKTNFQKYIDYNVKDVLLVERIEKKLKVMEMVISLAYMAKINFNDVFSPVKMWDMIIYNHLREQKIAIPQKRLENKSGAYEGAYVKDPKIGRHKWVCSFDLNSLYPHLIMQYNISPETLKGIYKRARKDNTGHNVMVETMLNKEDDLSFLEEQNLTMTPNGALYTRDKQGFLPRLMEEMYTNRVKYKKQMIEEEKKGSNANPIVIAHLHNLQLNLKIALNSAYGALGNQWFRYYNESNAEAVSVAGQLSIRWAERAVNDYLNGVLKTDGSDYVIASDTDSLYVDFSSLVGKVGLENTDKTIKFMDGVCEGKIEGVIEKCYEELAEYVHAFQQKMVMKREVLADVGIWTAKKHYILNVHNSEGVQYEKPKLKIMGIEAVKSSTPESVRNALKEAFKIIVNETEDDVINFIENYRKQFNDLAPEEVSFPRSVKGLAKYRDSVTIYRKSTPLHVKGSLIYNMMLERNKLTKKYPKIQEGEKIKYTYLKEPNPTGDSAIAMLGELPKEFKLEDYIDYDRQFQKSFLDPMRGILDTIGWDYERKSTIMDFFA